MSDPCDPVARGNTNTRAWCLTINNYKDEDLLKFDKFDKYIVGDEVGANGTKHLQCWIYKKNKIRFNTLKKIFPEAHIEKAKGSMEDNIKYCSKEKVLLSRGIKEPIIDYLKNKELYQWQKNLLYIYNNDINERKIYWFVDLVGCKGKTSFARHLIVNKYKVIYVCGKSKDIKYGLIKQLENDDVRMVIFDFTRTNENYISYQAIEELKNGIFFSSKYESGMCIFNIPHVICFSNFEPDESRLSKDRWNIINL